MGKRVIVLGVDGLEPTIVEELMEKGKLPNFSKLKRTGTYSHLSTTNPAESSVAWSSFITGTNPGTHGIFDFLLRDPQTYLPYLALAKFEPPKRSLTIADRKISLDRPKIVSYRKGVPFWEILSSKGISSIIIRCPMTFPPEKLKGKMLSGFGVPDIRGTQGIFSCYTEGKISDSEEAKGKIFPLNFRNGRADTFIRGPLDTSLKKPQDMKIPLYLELDKGAKKLGVLFRNKELEIREGEWSSWQKITFRSGLTKVRAICQFYLKSIEPKVTLYLSPLNFDPESPAFPISYPSSYAKNLAKESGLYCSLGQPGETHALNEGWISDEAALQQYYQVLEERKKMLFTELEKFRSGLFFCYIGISDTVQHMFWRTIDKKSPLYSSSLGQENVIPNFYQEIDRILGKVMNHVDNNTILIVLSDHGFTSFRRAVHLNTWLEENGFLELKEGYDVSQEFFEQVDWYRTKAYALGFTGIYINQRRREKYGIVAPGKDTDSVKDAIIEKLGKLTDPQNGKRVIKEVYRKEDIYHGLWVDNAPDLIVGYNIGYRTSWQTALGAVPSKIIEDNKKKWSGDHMVDPSLVPAVLFVNRKMSSDKPRIIDIAPTILNLFDIKPPESMDGHPLELVGDG